MELDKKALIEYMIEKAKDTIKAAKLLVDNNLLSHAENRIYYSIFYIVSALALKYDFSTMPAGSRACCTTDQTVIPTKVGIYKVFNLCGK